MHRPVSRSAHGAVAAALTVVLAGVLGLVAAGDASALAAKSVSATIAFSGTGTAMKATTTVRFTSTYTGTYNVKYDIYRSTSSNRTNPVKVNATTVFTRTLATTRGRAYAYGPNSTRCPAGTARYYYWVQGSVTDTTGGTVTVSSAVVAAKGCTSL